MPKPIVLQISVRNFGNAADAIHALILDAAECAFQFPPPILLGFHSNRFSG
jgi:hypothetical protein